MSVNVAKERWKLLTKAILKEENTNTESSVVSINNFDGFNLFKQIKLSHDWYEFSSSIFNTPPLLIKIPEKQFDPETLISFNNTGNVRIWPSEQIVAYYCLKHGASLFTENSKLLELGGGMTCLAGMTIACNFNMKQIVLTDGNERSITNVEEIMEKNTHLLKSKEIICKVLRWSENFKEETHDSNLTENSFDLIIAADCLFFDEFQLALLKTISFYLQNNGKAIIFAPRRFKTFNDFAILAKKENFSVFIDEEYDQFIFEEHKKYLKQSTYDPNLHFPILMVLRKL